MADSQHAEQETAFQYKLSYANIESISTDTKLLREGARCSSSSSINALQECLGNAHQCDRLARGDPRIFQRRCHTTSARDTKSEGGVRAVMQLMLGCGGSASQWVVQRQYRAGMHKEAIPADKVGVKESMCRTLLRACGDG